MIRFIPTTSQGYLFSKTAKVLTIPFTVNESQTELDKCKKIFS